MQRDIDRLASEAFDLVVLGAGIHGACVARDAALRGFRVAVIERGDLGGETSHNSLKTIHGGIRYIQHLNFTRTREAIREQQIWLRTAPHLVRPLDFVMPTYGHGMRGPLAMGAGIGLYRLLGGGRGPNIGSDTGSGGRVLGARALREMVPETPRDGLSGAAIWRDAQIRFADRAILEILAEAAEHGAVIASHAEATATLRETTADGVRAAGVALRDRLSGATHEVSARLVLNATGPWSGDLAGDLTGGEARPALTRSMNIVTRRPARDFALAIKSAEASDSKLGRTKRLFFEVPWEGCAIFGTTHSPAGDGPDAPADQAGDMAAFIAELNAAWPGLDLGMEDVLYCYRGRTPAENGAGGQARAHESRILDHGGLGGLMGVISIVGVKWTTGRLVAERAVDLASAKLGAGGPCRTRAAPIRPIEGVSYDLAGKSAPEIRSICQAHMARTQTYMLSDMLFRRSDDLARGRLGAPEIVAAARAMRDHLGWDAAECDRQIALMQARWLPSDILKIVTRDTLFEGVT